MNKKLLFGIMSLAALTACTNDDFESQNVAEETSPIQFEVINNAVTRASMNGNTIVWNADDGDLFTLYHGAAAGAVTGFENAIYTANKSDQGATLTTPSMIKQGRAIMVWPVDTAFRITPDKDLTITIPDVQIPNENGDISDIIPYVSDLVNIGARTDTKHKVTDYNTAGYERKYPVYMRPMASQLTLKADYDGTDDILKDLYETGTDPLIAGDPITHISVTSVSLLTQADGATKFTKTIPVKWTDPSPAITTQWTTITKEPNKYNAWEKVTDFNIATIGTKGEQVGKLTTKCLVGNESSKFLILPQADMAGAVAKGAVEVNTYYGKVLIAKQADYAESKYSDDEYNKAWYRIVSSAKAAATTWENASTPVTIDGEAKHKVVAINTALGMAQTLNDFSAHTAGSGITKGEPCGYSLNRYVIVDLRKLDMSDLHVTSDKQLRDVVRVWKKLGLGAVTVYLDGDANKEFEISQTTIETINKINNGGLNFQVKPCTTVGEECETIVITGGGEVKNIDFITHNAGTKVAVALNAGENWNWPGTDNTSASTKKIKVQAAGVSQIINKGTMENAATATLATYENNGTQNNVPFKNEGTWNITAGTKLNVQFNVTNIGTLNIEAGAQYRMDGLTQNVKFDNEAETLPQRMLDIVAPGTTETVGVVNNAGVFATVAAAGKTADINNYGLIEHKSLAAKTYITTNQKGGNFASAFNKTTNKMGMINFPWECKAAENVSISNALNTGFVAVTVNGEVTGELKASEVGSKVNYVIIKNGVTSIKQMAGTVKYLEINEPGTEIAWKVSEANTFTGLVILSDVNITQGTTVHVSNVFLGADMYVGGEFNNGTLHVLPSWNSYYGDTSDKFATNYFTF